MDGVTSSIDFCEPNYEYSSLLAEPWNAWTSLFISLLGLSNYFFYQGPLRHIVQFGDLIMVLCGLGSFMLHGTLHWFFQATDELPMLWGMICLCHVTIHMKCKPSAKCCESQWKYTLLCASIMTAFYLWSRHLYVIFFMSFLCCTLYVALTNTYAAYCDNYLNKPKVSDEVIERLIKMRRSAINWAYISFGLIAFVIWVFDMVLCDQIVLPFSRHVLGWTPHTIWHVGAAYGINFLTNISSWNMIQYRYMNQKERLDRGEQLAKGETPVCPGLPVCVMRMLGYHMAFELKDGSLLVGGVIEKNMNTKKDL